MRLVIMGMIHVRVRKKSKRIRAVFKRLVPLLEESLRKIRKKKLDSKKQSGKQ